MITEGGGWTMARNSTADVFLGRNFAEYEAGFGDPSIEDEIWLGLKWMHFITNATNATMRYYHEEYSSKISVYLSVLDHA
uniref:Fibrinogen C-terminal domain-containing protein n=1 Tax=Acrobeloides nanus TaxID=290746 RepID=A0A914DV95_9BILA